MGDYDLYKDDQKILEHVSAAKLQDEIGIPERMVLSLIHIYLHALRVSYLRRPQKHVADKNHHLLILLSSLKYLHIKKS